MAAPIKRELAVNPQGSVEISEPGVVSINDQSGGSSEKFLAVNAISDQESDLERQAPIEIAPHVGASSKLAQELAPTKSSRDATHYERFFAWCALALLALDLLRRIVFRSGWRERV